MKPHADRHATSSLAKASSVEVETDKRGRTFTIVISFKGNAPKALALAKHQQRLIHDVEHLVVGVLASPRPSASVRRLAQKAHEVATAPIRTKTPNSTIGVTSYEYLLVQLKQEADERNESLSTVARNLFERGFSALEDRLWNESPASVIHEFKDGYREFQSDSTKHWPLRLERRRYLKAVLVAKEQGLSLSHLACLCISTALTFATA